MADVTGARGTGNVTSGLRKVDIRDEILRYDADSTPLTVISARLDSKPTVNPQFKWYDQGRQTRRATTSTVGTGTSLTVSDGTLFAEHDVWRNTVAGENVRVQSVSGNTVTVVRGASPVAFANGDELILIGSAQPEGDTSKAARSNNPTERSNYTQIFRTPYEATRTWTQSGQYTRPKDWEFQAADAMKEHKLDLEAAFLWGVARETTSGAHPRRETGGAYSIISTNITDMGGAMTEAEFFAAYSGAFRYGSKTKFGFAARTPVDVINGFPRGKLEVVQADNDDTFGVNIMKYRSPHGTLNVATHNLLEDSTSTYKKDILILDFIGDGQRIIRRRYLTDDHYGSSDTHVRENIQEPDRDGRKDEVLTECGLEFALEKNHALMKNITS